MSREPLPVRSEYATSLAAELLVGAPGVRLSWRQWETLHRPEESKLTQAAVDLSWEVLSLSKITLDTWGGRGATGKCPRGSVTRGGRG